MAMDFFESQEVARKKTGRLVVMFVLAVLGIITAIYLTASIVIMLLQETQAAQQVGNTTSVSPSQMFRIDVLLITVVVVTLVVVGGSLFKIAQLRSGGEAVARMMGGRLLQRNTKDPDERKILNVVDEMAIASGTPVPPVYLMDKEQGINAFAAGYTPESAVIGVTRGCVEKLSRDELQGVVAHEFSHILNGDMRLNIKLIGILHGILIIGLIGLGIMRMTMYSGGGRNNRDGKAVLVMLGIGLLLTIIGYVGFFFGSMIKAAVSRQREYLADASAVQFTRNPDSIGGALQKIGGSMYRSRIRNAHAGELSHMFFSDAVEGALSSFGGMMATHPPLPERIKRVNPAWDGEFPKLNDRPEQASAHATEARVKRERAEKERREIAQQAMTAVLGGAVLEGAAASGSGRSQGGNVGGGGGVVEGIGRPTQEHVAYARALVEAMPAKLKEATGEALGARALVYGLLLAPSGEKEVRQVQVEQLKATEDQGVLHELKALLPSLKEMQEESRLPLLDMAIPALKQMTPKQYQAFRNNMDVMIKADNKVELLEWSLRQIVVRALGEHFEGKDRSPVRVYSLKGVRDDVAGLLSSLAYAGNKDKDAAAEAFGDGVAACGLDAMPLLPLEQCGLKVVERALQTLDTVSIREKRKLIQGCATVIAHDHGVTVVEGELLRVVSDQLGCPMPPLLPGQVLI